MTDFGYAWRQRLTDTSNGNHRNCGNLLTAIARQAGDGASCGTRNPRPAKPLFIGSIPIGASLCENDLRSDR